MPAIDTIKKVRYIRLPGPIRGVGHMIHDANVEILDTFRLFALSHF